MQIATPLIAELAPAIGHTVALAVWGTRGATIVRLEESPAAVHVNMRHGTVFSLANTASGRLFAAYLDASHVKARLEEERVQAKTSTVPRVAGMPPPTPVPSWKEFERQLAEVRAHDESKAPKE